MPVTKEVDLETIKPEDPALVAGRLFRLRYRAADDFGDSVLRHVVAPNVEAAIEWARANRQSVSYLPRKIRCTPLFWDAASETWKGSDQHEECIA